MPRADWYDRLLPQLEKRTTEHFDISFAKGSTAERDIEGIADERESGYRRADEFLDRVSEVRIRLVFFEDEGTKFEETGHRGMGWATGTTIVEVYNDHQRLDPYHEVTHILAEPLGDPPAAFSEGLAVYMSERLGAPALLTLGGGMLSLYERVSELKHAGDWIPLSKLPTYTEIGSAGSRPHIAYAQAGAFVKFLVDCHGKGNLLEAHAALKNSSAREVHRQNRHALEHIYGRSVDALDREWHVAMGLR